MGFLLGRALFFELGEQEAVLPLPWDPVRRAVNPLGWKWRCRRGGFLWSPITERNLEGLLDGLGECDS